MGVVRSIRCINAYYVRDNKRQRTGSIWKLPPGSRMEGESVGLGLASFRSSECHSAGIESLHCSTPLHVPLQFVEPMVHTLPMR